MWLAVVSSEGELYELVGIETTGESNPNIKFFYYLWPISDLFSLLLSV